LRKEILVVDKDMELNMVLDIVLDMVLDMVLETVLVLVLVWFMEEISGYLNLSTLAILGHLRSLLHWMPIL